MSRRSSSGTNTGAGPSLPSIRSSRVMTFPLLKLLARDARSSAFALGRNGPNRGTNVADRRSRPQPPRRALPCNVVTMVGFRPSNAPAATPRQDARERCRVRGVRGVDAGPECRRTSPSMGIQVAADPPATRARLLLLGASLPALTRSLFWLGSAAVRRPQIQLISKVVRNSGAPIRDLTHGCNGPGTPRCAVATCQEAPWLRTSAGVECDREINDDGACDEAR
jgi:hypothetical protein